MEAIKLFAGGNTPYGFYSYFEDVFDFSRAGRLFIVKGGSGVGKGTLIKKAGKVLEKFGDTEYYYCSGDPDSLDGVYSDKLNIAIMDGTAPHVMEPKIAGISGEIINLGDFLDIDKLNERRTEIENAVRLKKYLYSLAYGYLGAAGQIDGVTIGIEQRRLNQGFIDSKASAFLEKYPELNKGGRVKKAFIQAVTPGGVIDFEESTAGKNKVYVRANDTTISVFLSKIYQSLLLKGYDIDLYFKPLRPTMPTAMLIRDTNQLITATENLSSIDLTSALELSTQENNMIKGNKSVCDRLVSRAVEQLSSAKRVHKDMEKYYVAAMDWAKAEALTERFLSVLQNL